MTGDDREDVGPVGPSYAGLREHFLRDLARAGPPTTSVSINGRTLSLEAALRLIEQLPGEPSLSRQGLRIAVEPDPFAAGPSDAAPVDPNLARRLIARQDDTDRAAAEEQRERSWWHRLQRRLRGS